MLGFARKLVKQAEGIIAPEVADAAPSHGFRVLAVESDSEAFHAGIEPLFDFVVAANGTRFDAPAGPAGALPVSVEAQRSPLAEFEQTVRATQGKLVLEVWSAKGRVARVLALPNPAKLAAGLGLTLQWTPLSVTENVWHILDVRPHSPASAAGLISDSDYIVGAERGLLDEGGEGLLARVVSRADPQEGILFYVYNRDYDVVRPVRIVPTRDGKLGCGVGYGLLHSLPAVAPQSSRVPPGHTLFDDDAQLDAQLDAQYLDSNVSVALSDSKPKVVPPPTVPVPHAPRHHHAPRRNTQNADALSAYFDEQSEISHSIDGSAAAPVAAGVPPPPKAAP